MFRSLVACAALAGCAAQAQPSPDLVITMRIGGRVTVPEMVLRHVADATHLCRLPQRMRLPSATGPAPTPDQPPSHVFGYSVEFGPDYPPGVPQPSGDWAGYGPQTRFTLELFPREGQLLTTGPVQLGRAFRITVGTNEGLWQRTLEEDNPAAAAFIVLEPGGGRFRVPGLVRQIPHNRLPDSEAISVFGTWRCPSG